MNHTDLNHRFAIGSQYFIITAMSSSVYLDRGFAPITDAARDIKYLTHLPDVAIRFVDYKTAIPENPRGVIVVPLAPDRPIEGIRVISGLG